MYYNVIKSSVDGDRSQVFWVTQKLKTLRENTGQNSNIIHSGLTKMRNSLKEISFQKLSHNTLVGSQMRLLKNVI